MILVAGGTGHMGRVLVQRLIAGGSRVRVLTRDPSRARGLWAGDIELVAGDVTDATSLRPALTDVDSIVSAVTGFGPGGGGPEAVDFRGNENLITAGEASGARRYVLVSIRRAGPNHAMVLNRMKFLAEERLRKSRLGWTIIRPTVFMELWTGIVGGSAAKKGLATVFGRGDNPINFVSVEDVARDVELALTDRTLNGSTIDVSGPENLTLNRLVQIFEEVLGKKVSTRHVPLAMLRAAAVMMGPIKPDIARLIAAAVAMATADMSLDPSELSASGKPIIDVVRAQCADPAGLPIHFPT